MSTSTSTDTPAASNGVATTTPLVETTPGPEPNSTTGASTQVSGNATTATTTTTQEENSSTSSSNQVEQDIIKEMSNFDNLLKMLSMYKDNPDFRGNPNDKNIEEIARVLSGFIGDDIDDFLSESDDDSESPEESTEDKDNNNVES